jgi:hypothetical protein
MQSLEIHITLSHVFRDLAYATRWKGEWMSEARHMSELGITSTFPTCLVLSPVNGVAPGGILKRDTAGASFLFFCLLAILEISRRPSILVALILRTGYPTTYHFSPHHWVFILNFTILVLSWHFGYLLSISKWACSTSHSVRDSNGIIYSGL